MMLLYKAVFHAKEIRDLYSMGNASIVLNFNLIMELINVLTAVPKMKGGLDKNVKIKTTI